MIGPPPPRRCVDDRRRRCSNSSCAVRACVRAWCAWCARVVPRPTPRHDSHPPTPTTTGGGDWWGGWEEGALALTGRRREGATLAHIYIYICIYIYIYTEIFSYVYIPQTELAAKWVLADLRAIEHGPSQRASRTTNKNDSRRRFIDIDAFDPLITAARR